MSEPRITPLRFPGRAPRVLTIDVEDWFHVCGDDYYSDPRRWESFLPRIEKTLLALLDRVERGGHRATLFFLGWIAGRHPDLVREAVRRGHEIAVHGDLHRRADEMSGEEFREDLRYWVETERKTARRVLTLVEAILRGPFRGIGKLEPLKYLGAGVWSRRLTQEHRLVYVVSADRVDFLQARYHY